MIKYFPVFTLLLMLAFYSSCGGQNKPDLTKENIEPATKDKVTFSVFNEKYHSKYVYTDAIGKCLIIQNSFPKGSLYTSANGKEYFKITFFSRVLNETDYPLELKVHFPADSFELSGFYYKILVPPDTMTIDKEMLNDYGLTGIKSFLDTIINNPLALKKIVHPKESTGFYIVLLRPSTKGASGGFLRTGLSIRGQQLFYRISQYENKPTGALIDEKEINCGSINLKNLMLQN